jgi:phosphatidylglycerol:prolipoprotein diacylglycerol transferase
MIRWNASPEIFQLGPLTLRWYGLLFATGFALGYQVVKRFFIREKVSIELLDPLVFYLMVGTIIGARLGHCLFYEPEIYLRDPIRILKVWEGGLASHGGALGVLVALYFYVRKFRQFTYLYICDRVAVAATLAGAMIRLGNLFNSEIIGKPTTVPWAFVFERIDQLPRHPTQLYESFSYFLIFAVLEFLYWKTELRKAPGFLFGFYLVSVFSARMLIELFKEPQVAFEVSMPLDLGQLLSIPAILCGIALMIWAIKKQKQNARTSSH